MYPEHLTRPMAQELENQGFISLKTSEEVANVLDKKEGTVFVVINSVCGCAASNARPAAIAASKNEKHPDQLITVFAGVDKEAVDKVRTYLFPYHPSSPSMAVFHNGELVHMLERSQIEGKPAQMVANSLIDVFNEYC
ncbi:MAG: BrxA/BrxB family bacilliredoxin [Chitinophagales bacterium]|nr:BrxA/BrxB family bacilliredoxin [Chitinophagales bacterium]MCZ2392465.1 BrxA/BrxB family bacilliredoxin [Chitinophagales bacterium]